MDNTNSQVGEQRCVFGGIGISPFFWSEKRRRECTGKGGKVNRVDYLSVTSSDGAILKLIEPLRGRRTLVVAPVVFRSLRSR